MVGTNVSLHVTFSTDSIPTGPLFVLAIGILCIVWGFVLIRRYRLIADTATSRIGGVAIGFAEVKGRVRITEPVVDPLTGTRCARYDLVEEYYASGEHAGGWTTHRSWRETGACELDDGTGRVALSTDNVSWSLEPTRRWVRSKGSESPNEPGGPPPALETLEEIEPTKEGRRGQFRYTLTTIKEGDEIYALGTVSRGEPLTIGKGAQGVYVVSNMRERDILTQLRRSAAFIIVFGLVFAIVATLIMLV